MIVAQDLTYILALSFAVAAFSITVAKSEIFTSFRLWVLCWTKPKDQPRDEFLNDVTNGKAERNLMYRLLSCPYCLSHWVAILGVLVCPATRLDITSSAPLNYVLSVFAVVGIANFFGGFIIKNLDH